MKKLFLSAKDIQEILGISRSAAYTLLHSGVFPVIHCGGNIRVSIEAFERWSGVKVG